MSELVGAPPTEDDIEDLDEVDLEDEPELGPSGRRALERLMAKVSEVTEQGELEMSRPGPSVAEPHPPGPPTPFAALKPAAVGTLPSHAASPRPLSAGPPSPSAAPVLRPAVPRGRSRGARLALVLLCAFTLCLIGYWMFGGAEPPAVTTTARPESGAWRSLVSNPVSAAPASAEPAPPPPETARDVGSVARRSAPEVERSRAERRRKRTREPEPTRPPRPPRRQTEDPFALHPLRSRVPGGP